MTNQSNPYEAKTVADVLAEFKVQERAGLNDTEVQERQKTYGLNEGKIFAPSDEKRFTHARPP